MKDHYWLDEGFECAEEHFVSNDALARHVKTETDKRLIEIKCPGDRVRKQAVFHFISTNSVVYVLFLFSVIRYTMQSC